MVSTALLLRCLRVTGCLFSVVLSPKTTLLERLAAEPFRGRCSGALCVTVVSLLDVEAASLQDVGGDKGFDGTSSHLDRATWPVEISGPDRVSSARPTRRRRELDRPRPNDTKRSFTVEGARRERSSGRSDLDRRCPGTRKPRRATRRSEAPRRGPSAGVATETADRPSGGGRRTHPD